MIEQFYSDCNCEKSREHGATCKCECRCSCECCCNCLSRYDCHRNRCHNRCHSCCRRDLCNKDFQINLAGLTDGLNYRLRKLLWVEVEIGLDNGGKVKGTITFIGSNFIEVVVKNSNLDSEDTVQEESEFSGEIEKRDQNKGDSWIVPIMKIATVELTSISNNGE